jgi:hypothetical protein
MAIGSSDIHEVFWMMEMSRVVETDKNVLAVSAFEEVLEDFLCPQKCLENANGS